MKIFKYTFIIFIICFSCTEESLTPEQKAINSTEDGWFRFSNKEYDQAIDYFLEAIDYDDAYAEAYNGAGWTYARLVELNTAITYFNQCLSIENDYTAANAGLAFIYFAQKKYELSVSTAKTILDKAPYWKHNYDSSVGYRDLQLIIADCYFAQGKLNESLQYVQIINSSFNADVTTFEGKSALAAEIERLHGTV